jgi:hypothetical protein
VDSIIAQIAQIPWWAATGFVCGIVLLAISKTAKALEETDPVQPQEVKESFRETLSPFQMAALSTRSGRVISRILTYKPEPQTEILTSELSFEGEDAKELYALISSGNKEAAIKLVCEKKSIDPVQAESVVEAMIKFA